MFKFVGLNSTATKSVAMKRLTTVSTRRLFNTESTSTVQAQKLLEAQRGARPISPHLTIYQPQLTWYLSSVHRVSGVFMGFVFFGTTIAFGVSSLFNLGLNTEKLVKYYHEKIPAWFDYTVKGGFAYIFAFHFGNGIRHLIWDTGKAFTIPGIYKTGYAVLALTAVAGSYLFSLGV
ncbi:related to Succinate dehydrogenase [ubiquinone] cytochrome b subunit, mitochondrial [Saccharomycodes ludwigii]|uniref:Related to Succinate dehydrogenase [ubiquinone] cytochrome b subunit, mitochondrial n=1 Tax=Saccharomycodes ludwigii TaxID=36035 RepID=A0A376B0R0_9ASCO|nr:hypothetical protein SCDLUD_003982 [Saccharomycodes ludwigii]KAH3899697.1 hypothetical protein SCDLUD_003982 [Saccharomycodes ludwigii]SSD58275.1 related to Succinate dehydrogenase [ubiquinone] cytochrome b subunit, mitochondrial [Saccharomycodes ludwigii]